MRVCQRTVAGHRDDARAPFHCARASRFERRRAAVELPCDTAQTACHIGKSMFPFDVIMFGRRDRFIGRTRKPNRFGLTGRRYRARQ
jgi:hypothetical protein